VEKDKEDTIRGGGKDGIGEGRKKKLIKEPRSLVSSEDVN